MMTARAFRYIVAVAVFVAAVWMLATCERAHAACTTGAVPFQLQNNTLADATQVMANFNSISTGVSANCAGSGNNNDILSLGALVTPISPSQGGTPVFIGGVAGGSANALTLTVPSNFTLTPNFRVTGIVGTTNTAAATLQVNGTTTLNVFRKTQLGAVITNGGELIAGNPFTAVYNGSAWVIDNETFLIGEMKQWSTLTPPPGYMIADGSSFVCANFSSLCAVIGTTFGGTALNPLLPDTRGRALVGLDNYGTAPGAANRLTIAATGCGTSMTAVGATCATASQSHTQIVAELAQHNHVDSGHAHTQQGCVNGTSCASGATTAVEAVTIATTNTAALGLTATSTANIQNTGSSQPMPIVNPNLGMVSIIRF